MPLELIVTREEARETLSATGSGETLSLSNV